MADLIFLFVLVAFLAVRLYGVFGKGEDGKNVRVILKPVNKNDGDAVNNVVQIVKAQEAVDKNAALKDEAEFNK